MGGKGSHMATGQAKMKGADGASVEEILDAIGDECARDILVTICRDSRSAKEIAEATDYSLQTIYRRIDLLEEHGLVTSRTRQIEGGPQDHIFETTFDSALISVDDGEYTARIYQQQNLPDEFASLWSDLSPSA